MQARSSRRGGATLLFVAVMILVVGLLSTAVFTVSSASQKVSSFRLKRGKLRGCAEQGVAFAYYEAWNLYLKSKSGTPGNFKDYQSYLTNTLLLANGATLTVFDQTMSDRTHVVAQINRQDGTAASFLTVSSVATGLDGEKDTITTIFKVGGKPYPGFQYGLLTRNVDCMMCHLNVQNIDMVNNKDPSKYGSFKGAKVGISDQLLVRSDVQATIGGQLITRGAITDSTGKPITSLAGYNVDGLKTDPATGNVIQNGSGGTSEVDLYSATGTPLPANANFYTNYPTDPSKASAGELPANFPPPIPDGDGNRKIDATEFASFASSANGTLSGGVIYQTGTYSGTTLPASGNTTSIAGSNAGSGKNTFLIGTKANPIVLNGTVALDGDVVISGYVKGTGELAAKGNVYVMGDLMYADGTDAGGNRTYGVASDGSQNAIALTSGGNVMVGAYIQNKNGGVMAPSDNSLLNVEIGTFNRTEWTKTQAFLPDSSGKMVANATYDANYVPRYYVMNDGDPVYISAPVSGQSNLTYKDVYWDPSSSSWKASKNLEQQALTDNNKITAPSGAAVSALNPAANWISNSDFATMFTNQDKTRTSGKPIEIDALMYSSNMIFALTRSTTSSKGYLTVNGAMISADAGLLAAGATNLNYDARTAQFIHIEDPTQVTPHTVVYMEK